MEKIYGYKEKDIVGLAEFIKNRQAGTLTNAFVEFATKSGKAQGTVRNLYYALAKKSATDSEFCQKYFNGKPLEVSKIQEFSSEQERALVRDILAQKLKGRSVRSVILEMANGNEKTALRYQNKYRNCLKNNPELIKELTVEIVGESEIDCAKRGKQVVLEAQMKKYKGEINILIDKICLGLRKENDKLRAKIAFLEQELKKNDTSDKALRFFARREGKMLNC